MPGGKRVRNAKYAMLLLHCAPSAGWQTSHLSPSLLRTALCHSQHNQSLLLDGNGKPFSNNLGSWLHKACRGLGVRFPGVTEFRKLVDTELKRENADAAVVARGLDHTAATAAASYHLTDAAQMAQDWSAVYNKTQRPAPTPDAQFLQDVKAITRNDRIPWKQVLSRRN